MHERKYSVHEGVIAHILTAYYYCVPHNTTFFSYILVFLCIESGFCIESCPCIEVYFILCMYVCTVCMYACILYFYIPGRKHCKTVMLNTDDIVVTPFQSNSNCQAKTCSRGQSSLLRFGLCGEMWSLRLSTNLFSVCL